MADTTTTTTTTTTATETPESVDSNISALQDNIERKGKNAYYFAHAHKATGPKWDGKPEPKLLSKQASSSLSTTMSASFDFRQSNITTYAFLNNEKNVKLYVEMEGVGTQCTDEDVTLEWTPTSLGLVIQNYCKPSTASADDDEDTAEATPSTAATPQCLKFAKLSGIIRKASYKLKDDRIILTLTKETPGEEWHTINDKGAPDHEVV